MLVLWYLTIALYIVHWVLRTIVQLPVAMYYNGTHANIFMGMILINPYTASGSRSTYTAARKIKHSNHYYIRLSIVLISIL